jgi:hypothetical protein
MNHRPNLTTVLVVIAALVLVSALLSHLSS